MGGQGSPRWWSMVRGSAGDVGRARRRMVLLVVGIMALIVAGCGEDPAASPADVDQAGDEPETEVDEGDEGADESAAEPDDAAAADEEDEEEGAISSHRPSDATVSGAACDEISQDEPGASIVFPSEDGATTDAGDGPVTVEVVGCSNTFEANIQYEAFHGEDSSPTLEGFTSGGTLGEWAEFRFEETYWTPGDWTVVVFELDAASGDRREYDTVTFSVG